MAAEHVPKLRDILARLEITPAVSQMDVPGFRLHPPKATWGVTVRANWRAIFRFIDGSALDVDYVEYY